MHLHEYVRDWAWRMWEPLSGKPSRFPDFLGIGAQKAGTTWLHENLSRHPDVFLPKAKELHFFNANFHRGFAHYRSHFSGQTEKACGEITPAYGHLSVDRIKVIRDANPQLKLVLLLRHPVQRAWSGALMNLAERRGRVASDIPLTEFAEFLRSPSSVRRSSYIDMIENWTAHFPETQLFIGFYEDIVSRPVDLFRDILKHLGVDDNILPEQYALEQVVIPRVKPGEGGANFAQTLAKPRPHDDIPESLLHLLEDIYGAEIQELAHRFASPCQNWLRSVKTESQP